MSDLSASLSGWQRHSRGGGVSARWFLVPLIEIAFVLGFFLAPHGHGAGSSVAPGPSLADTSVATGDWSLGAVRALPVLQGPSLAQRAARRRHAPVRETPATITPSPSATIAPVRPATPTTTAPRPQVVAPRPAPVATPKPAPRTTPTTTTPKFDSTGSSSFDSTG